MLLFNKAAPAVPIWAGGPVTAPPVVSFWDGGVFWLQLDRFPLFVAWADGTVVRRVPKPDSDRWIYTSEREDGSAWRYKGDVLRLCRADPAEITRLVTEIKNAGWFDPSVQCNVLMVDGPTLETTVWLGGKRQTRIYYGREEWEAEDMNVQGYGAYVRMWKRVKTAIGAVPLTEVGDYSGYPPLERPR